MYLQRFERTLSSGKIISFLILNFTFHGICSDFSEGTIKIIRSINKNKKK